MRPYTLDRIMLRRARALGSSATYPHRTSSLSQVLVTPIFPLTQVVKVDNTYRGVCEWKRERSALEGFRRFRGSAYSPLQKGGDPAAGSPTATLLRLRPSH